MTSYREANHPPIVVIAGDKDRRVARNDVVKLDVSSSGDPDGDSLRYSWWQYRDAGTFPGLVKIDNADQPVASVRVPSDAKAGNTIHLIAEVTDSGKPALIRYARVILTVRPR